MEAQGAPQTVLFADICDSTRIYHTLGDEGGRRVLLECVELMRQVVERCRGTVVDHVGDELMCTFPDAAGAGRASCELHRAIEAANTHLPATVDIRVGFHHGPLLRDGERVFGDTIHVAKRVASLAKAQQTLITGQAKDLVPLEEQLVTRFVDRTHLKGRLEPFELFEIVWDAGAATDAVQRSGPTTARMQPTRELLLGSGERTHTVDATYPTLSIGRDPRVDVVVDHPRVSRLHARIEYRKDAFVFVDQSTNGSQVVDEDGVSRFVRRDECPLMGAGTIALGPETSNRNPSLVYRIRWRDRDGRSW